MNDNRIKNQKQFMFLHTVLIAVLLIYTVVNFEYVILNNTYNTIVISIILLNYVVSILFVGIKAFKNWIIYTTQNLIYLCLFSCFLYNEDVFLFGTAFILYFIIAIELIIINYEQRESINRYLFYVSLIPFMVVTLVAVYTSGFDIHIIFFGILFLIAFLGVYFIISRLRVEIKANLIEQKELWEKTKLTNSQLKSTQENTQKIYDEMFLQKSELETANKELNRVLSETFIQNELLKYLSSTLDYKKLLDMAIDSIIGATGVDTCYVIIENAESTGYHCRSKSIHHIDVETNLLDSLNHGELQKYFDMGESIADEIVELNEYSFIKERPAGSLIITPLIREDEVYGLLFAEHATQGMLSEKNLPFFEAIATQISIAVHNAGLYSKMQEFAMLDGLTSIYNRRYFMSKLYNLVESSKKSNKIFSVVLFDLDKFKNINDTYGHVFGDDVLKMVAKIINSYAEENDGFVGRYGGEEFIMAFPDKHMEETLKVIEQMHDEIKTTPIKYDDGSDVYINISQGISSYPEFGLSVEILLHRVDKAMYYSKEHGRGRITLDSEEFTVIQNV